MAAADSLGMARRAGSAARISVCVQVENHPSCMLPARSAESASCAEKKPPSPGRKYAITAIGALLLFLVTAAAPPELTGNITVFDLAIVIGYYVIGHVHHALHTPLMSITNAISGIIIVGALLQIGTGDTVVTVLAFIAILVASINIFGGFAVTRRMLGMFQR